MKKKETLKYLNKFTSNEKPSKPKINHIHKSELPSINSTNSRNLLSKSMVSMRKPKKEQKEKHDLPSIQKRIKKYESGSKKMLSQFRYLSPPPIEQEMLVNMSQPSPLVNIRLN